MLNFQVRYLIALPAKLINELALDILLSRSILNSAIAISRRRVQLILPVIAGDDRTCACSPSLSPTNQRMAGRAEPPVPVPRYCVRAMAELNREPAGARAVIGELR
jgi:hypothetical protein